MILIEEPGKPAKEGMNADQVSIKTVRKRWSCSGYAQEEDIISFLL